MDWNSMSNSAILAESGKRIKDQRLRKELTQQDLADRAGVSVFTVGQIEKGKPVSTGTLVAILRVLRLLNNLEMLLPELTISPVEMLKLKGEAPKRIYRPRTAQTK